MTAAAGGCVGGLCQPVTVTASEVALEELRVAGDRLLYRANASVRAVEMAGGLPSTLASCAINPGLAVSDAGFYSWCGNALTLRDVGDGGTRAGATIDGYEGILG